MRTCPPARPSMREPSPHQRAKRCASVKYRNTVSGVAAIVKRITPEVIALIKARKENISG